MIMIFSLSWNIYQIQVVFYSATLKILGEVKGSFEISKHLCIMLSKISSDFLL